ncbi:unnamed protein product [Peniophora sp. CBMAI 1063]|nr:unnamed protein product [Peniophora sp. CBMAI 1063]
MADFQAQNAGDFADEFIDDVEDVDAESNPSSADEQLMPSAEASESESNGGIEGGTMFWESDSESSTHESTSWGPTAFVTGRGPAPYREDEYDFGWKATRPPPWRVRRLSYPAVGFGADSFGDHPDGPWAAEEEADPNPQDDEASAGSWNPEDHDGSNNELPAASLDVFTYVLGHVVPAAGELPLDTFFERGGRGAESIASLTSMMHTCRLWRDTTLSLSALVWGPLVSEARDEAGFLIAMERARDAKVRLVYRSGIPRSLLDAQLERASAVYAGRDFQWRHFGIVLAKNDLRHLEVLYLRPNTSRMPNTALRIYGPLDMQSLRIYVSACPIIVKAPHLQYLGLLFHTLDQITTVLENLALAPLQWLWIDKPRETRKIDLTALVRMTASQNLKFLRITGNDTMATSLDATQDVHVCDSLEILDVSGPIWVSSLSLDIAKFFNVYAADLRRILSHNSSVSVLSIRWHSEATLHVPPPFPWADDLEGRVMLERLRDMRFAGVISRETVVFLDGIHAPNLTDLQVFCDMPPPPRHDVLAAVHDDLRDSLHDAQVNATPPASLSQALRTALSTLQRDGHKALARSVLETPGFPHAWATDDEPFTAGELQAAAVSILLGLEQAMEAPPAVHNGHLLRDVASAALRAAEAVHEEHAVLSLVRSRDSIDFEATTRDGACTLRFSMATTRTNEWARWDVREKGDSMLYGVARMLHGLQTIRPRALNVRGDPFPCMFGEVFGSTPDRHALHDALREYGEVTQLRLEYGYREYVRRYDFLLALHDATVLPSLEHLIVRCVEEWPLPEFELSRKQYFNERDKEVDETLDALWEMLSSRANAGGGIKKLELVGRCCIAEAHASRLKSACNSLVISTDCLRRAEPYECTVCG